MGRMACTEPQCLYKGDLYLYHFYVYSLIIFSSIFFLILHPAVKVNFGVLYEQHVLQPM